MVTPHNRGTPISDEKALLAAIWEHPHEDTPRLMYADWLDERGAAPDGARAEFIRAQCALEQLDGNDPRFDELEVRVEALTKKWEKEWKKAMPKGAKEGHVFDRGFLVPYLGRFSVANMVKLGRDRLGAAPLWRYHYGVHGSDLDRLLAWPFLHRLEMFALRPPLPTDWAERVATCDNLRNVTELALIDCWPPADDLKTVLDAWTDRHLRHLRLNVFEESAIRLIANHPACAGLRSLDIDESYQEASAVRVLAKGRSLTRLLSLSWDDSPFGDKGVTELLKWPALSKLRRLGLCSDRITNAGAEALAACKALSNLRALWLSDNRIGATGARALAASLNLGRLNRIGVYDNPMISETAKKVLRARFPESYGT